MSTATLSATAQPSAFNSRPQKRYAPARSSPLACTQSAPAATHSANGGGSGLPSIAPQRTQSFPTSRPIRPFESIAPKAASKPVKTFELPEAFKSGCFMLNLTQAEFSRQE